jgi:hypothetical protein
VRVKGKGEGEGEGDGGGEGNDGIMVGVVRALRSGFVGWGSWLVGWGCGCWVLDGEGCMCGCGGLLLRGDEQKGGLKRRISWVLSTTTTVLAVS